MQKISNTILKYYYSLNNSKLLLGLAMLFMNIFSKYIEINLSRGQQEYIRNAIGREIFIFIIVFIGTRDIIISFILTASFIILANTVFNENSNMCMLPAKYKYLNEIIDTNNDNYISDKEIQNARNIINKANIQKNKTAQIYNLNYFQNNI
jgi:hypothetical protein